MSAKHRLFMVVLIYVFTQHETLAQNATSENITESSDAVPTKIVIDLTSKQPQPSCDPKEANVFVDDILKKIQNQMPNTIPLPDVEQYFLQLTEGYISSINTLQRNGDATLECGKDYARLTIPFRTRKPIGTYYVWKHRLVPLVSGSSTSQIQELKGQLVLKYKLTEHEAIIDELSVTDLGQLSIQVQLGQTSFIPNVFSTVSSQVTSAMTTFLKPFLQTKINAVLSEALNRALQNVRV